MYDSVLDNALSTSCKLLLRWSAPRQVIEATGNSYSLQTLEGFPVSSWVHAQWLWEFIPRLGTALAAEEGWPLIDEDEVLEQFGNGIEVVELEADGGTDSLDLAMEGTKSEDNGAESEDERAEGG